MTSGAGVEMVGEVGEFGEDRSKLEVVVGIAKHFSSKRSAESAPAR
jgi:hypothetical protein